MDEEDRTSLKHQETVKFDAFGETIQSDLPVQVGEVAEREGAHVVEGLRHSVVRLGHHSTEGEKIALRKTAVEHGTVQGGTGLG